MTLIFKQLFSFIKLLNSETGINQISAGIACGVILGFSPVLSLQGFIILFVIFFFRVQMGAAFIAAFFFAFPAYLLDPLLDRVGQFILQNSSLYSSFVVLYNMPLVPLTRFNNSVVMGSGAVTIFFAPAVFFISRFVISKYRQQIVERFKSSRFWKIVKMTSLYQWYIKYEELLG